MKTKRLRAVIIGLAACALLVTSVGLVSARVSGRMHPVQGNSPSPTLEIDLRDHGVGLLVNPESNFLWESDPTAEPPGGFWPAGSENSYLYLSTYWVGIMRNGIVTVMATQEGATDIISYNEWRPEGNNFDDTLWFSEDPGWPPIPGEPTLSEQDSLTVVVDDNPHAAWGGGERIGLRLKRHNLSWSVPDHDDWITYWFTLTNINSSTNLEGLYFSCAWDIDVRAYGASYMSNLVGYEGNDSTDEYTNPTVAGNVWNATSSSDGIPDEYDAVNFQPVSPFLDKPDFTFPNHWPRNTAYMYSEETSPGYIFCRLFGYRLPGEDQTENQLLVTSQHSWDIYNDPSNDSFMYGYQSDVGVYQEIASTPFDWRICPTVGPFNLDATQSVDFYVGLMVTDAQGSVTSLLEGRRNLDQLVYDWLTDFKIASPPHSPLVSASHSMNNTDPSITLRWTPRWAPGKNAETDIDTTGSMVADFDGYIIWRSVIGFDTGWEVQIMYDKNSNGHPEAYHPWGIHGGIENNTDGSPRLPVGVTADKVVDFGQIESESSYNYRWEDTNVVGGRSYYYSITCYDFGWNAPAVEDKLEPVRGGYSFNALTIKPLPFKQATADNVLVVPNPYRGEASWERWTTNGVREQKIMFMNLPSPCTIRVFTASGDLVKTIKYNDTNYGAAEWNLTTDAGLLVTSGVYFYHVDSSVGKKIGKFAILMGSSD